MTKPPELDKFSGRPVNTDTTTITFTGLSSDGAKSLMAAFTKWVDRCGSNEHTAQGDFNGGQYNLRVTDGATVLDKLLASLAAHTAAATAPAAPAAE